VDAYKSVQPAAAIGRLKFKDLNGDGKLDDTNDRTWIGVQIPKITYGLNVDLGYKGFDLSFFWQGVGGNKLNNSLRSRSTYWSDPGTNRDPSTITQSWLPDRTNTDIPMLTLVDVNRESRFSTWYVQSGAYCKLRNLQLGYTFPESILDKIKLSKLRIYISGENLVTFETTHGKYKVTNGIDPEIIDNYGNYPLPMIGTLGINLTF